MVRQMRGSKNTVLRWIGARALYQATVSRSGRRPIHIEPLKTTQCHPHPYNTTIRGPSLLARVALADRMQGANIYMVVWLPRPLLFYEPPAVIGQQEIELRISADNVPPHSHSRAFIEPNDKVLPKLYAHSPYLHLTACSRYRQLLMAKQSARDDPIAELKAC